VFWIWDENNFDNLLMFLAVAKTFQLLVLACHVHEMLGGDTARTADLNWPKGIFHTV